MNNVKTTIQWASPFSLGLSWRLAVAALAGLRSSRWLAGRPIEPARRRGLLVLRLLILAVLGLILLNPVRVDETPGIGRAAEGLLPARYVAEHGPGQGDRPAGIRSSQTIRDAEDARATCETGAQVSLFRFGSRLAAIDVAVLAAARRPVIVGAAMPGRPRPPRPRSPSEPPPAPTDSDTLLSSSLEGLTDRFGQNPPQGRRRLLRRPGRDPERSRRDRPRLWEHENTRPCRPGRRRAGRRRRGRSSAWSPPTSSAS